MEFNFGRHYIVTVFTGAHAEALGREAVWLHVAGLHLALLSVRRAVAALSVAFGYQAVRVRRVRQTVFAVRSPGQARACTPQADGRRGRRRRQTAVAVTTAPPSEAHRGTTDRGHHSGQSHLIGHRIGRQ